MKPSRLHSVLIPAAITVLAACQDANDPTTLVDPKPAFEEVPDLGATIVFTRLSESQDQNENVVAEIYIMNADGSDQRRVTFNSHFDIGAVMSPDGRTVAFHQGHAEHCCAIRVVDVATGVERELANGQWPSWSPDGRQLAFNSPGVGGVGDIWTINLDGTGLVNLTQTASPEARPDWSPNGQLIAFQTNRGGRTDIWVMNADGSNPMQVTTHPAADQAPDWAPDGRRIVYQSNRDDPGQEIYVINADGTGDTRLTFSPGRDLDPAWSPDGRSILFDSDRDYIAEQLRQVYIMNADGSGQRPLTFVPSENGHPAWGRGPVRYE